MGARARRFDLGQSHTVAKPIGFLLPDTQLPVVGGPPVVKIILIIGAILMLRSSDATAQERLAVGHCVADFGKLCPGIPLGDNLRACLREHIRDVSFPCLVTLAKFAEVRRSLKEECSAHLHQQCASVERAGGQFGACLRSAVASLSDTCKYALARAVRRARSW